MEEKQITQLMLAMRRTGIKKLIIKKEGVELHLEREDSPHVRSFEPSAIERIEDNPLKSDFERHRVQSSSPAPLPIREVKAAEDINALFVTAPMVGTVYQSPTPTDPPFVKPGDRVEKNTVVCIIEAMKVMNEVKAGKSGTVAEVLVDNAHPVEFSTKLFRIV